MNNAEIEAEVRRILVDWDAVDVLPKASFWVITGSYNGRMHVAVPVDPIDGAKRLDAIAKTLDVAAPAVEPQVSDGLRALLDESEHVSDGKARLLREYNKLTQLLLDDKYVMSPRETNRHEAISAIMLELRG